MKKLSLFLALVTVLTLCVCSFGIGISAARPIDAFTQIDKPAEANIRKTTYRFYRVWGVENPVGQWDPFAYQDGGMGEGTSMSQHSSSVTFADSNKAALILCYNDFDRHTLTELVFADIFTISGMGNQGRTRMTPEIWDKITVVVSDDCLNWRKVNFTVSYHTENNVHVDSYGQESNVDLYWHLSLEETTTAKYFAIHTSEAAAWDADDYAPKLGIVLAHDFFYGVNTSGIEPDILGTTRYLYMTEKAVGGHVINDVMNADGTLSAGNIRPEPGVFYAYLNDGATKSFPYVGYKNPISVNELVIGDVSHWHPETPIFTDFASFEIYYTDDMNGAWTKADFTGISYDCGKELNGTYQQGIRFVLDETVTAKYFLLYHPNPETKAIHLSGSTFTAVFDPANGTEAPPASETTEAVVTTAPETNEAPENTEAPETNAPETNGSEKTSEDEGGMTWLYIVVAAAAVVIVIVVVVVIAKKRKA